MKERDWLNRVLALADAFGWKAWHVAAPMRSDGHGGFVGDPRAKGLPDLILIHDDPPRLIFAELKGTGGKLSEAQREFLTMARDVADAPLEEEAIGHVVFVPTVGVYCWYPEDEPMVEQILRSRVLA